MPGEHSAWQTVRGNLKVVFPRCHIQRFEDKLTAGIPDTNFCWNGYEVWLEGKYLVLPKRLNTPVRVDLRPEQCTWLENRQRSGGLAYSWIRVENTGWILVKDEFRKWQREITKQEALGLDFYGTCQAMLEALKEDIQYGS